MGKSPDQPSLGKENLEVKKAPESEVKVARVSTLEEGASAVRAGAKCAFICDSLQDNKSGDWYVQVQVVLSDNLDQMLALDIARVFNQSWIKFQELNVCVRAYHTEDSSVANVEKKSSEIMNKLNWFIASEA